MNKKSKLKQLGVKPQSNNAISEQKNNVLVNLGSIIDPFIKGP